MNKEQLPNRFEEYFRTLSEEGSVSFIIEYKHKKRFYNCIQRLNKLNKLFRRNRTLINSIITLVYGMYVGVLQILLTSSSQSLDDALTTYQGTWRHISAIGGEELPNNKVKVIYHGRT